ncbi:MAG: 50S ribosomal protein L11 methyltransferase [Chloroflexota bacterium]|nr:50S ribosomal protein L11 methyltransferase [Chloroflexota bacterium]
MRYIELSAAVDPACAEAAADVLRALTGGGVAIEAPFTQQDLEAGAVRSADGAALVRAYVADGARSASLVRTAADALRAAGIRAEVTAGAVDEQDWAEAWKEHFHIERFGRVVVVPSWRAYDASPSDIVLTLDPGMAFGTGQHETTRMCMEALGHCVRPGARVLDAGCGSGILAIAAAKLGAAGVLAVDIDPDCVRITGENARANGVDASVRAELARPGDAAWAAAGMFDVVVANIIAATIIDLAPSLVGALAADGRLIVSGIIAAREAEVCAALAGAGARLDGVRAMGAWRCIEAVRADRVT